MAERWNISSKGEVMHGLIPTMQIQRQLDEAAEE
jgi:hypothetical protein